jgi:small-conductance mechanosensitive channel
VSFAEAIRHPFFEIAGTPVNAVTLFVALLIVLAAALVSRAMQRAMHRFLAVRGLRDEGSLRATNRLVHYSVLALGVGIALHTLGLNLAALFTAGAFFAVALGFAMQNITQNFVSGIILLAERTIKPGDVLVVNGSMVKVSHMGIRATVARTLDDDDVILPNSDLVQSAVINRTLRDPYFRLRTVVGVTYDSDMRQVREVLEKAARGLDWRDAGHEPVVLLVDFGSSSVDWEVSVWIENPFAERRCQSLLREAIWFALKDAGIVIAFPQLDVHLDPPALEAIRGQGK